MAQTITHTMKKFPIPAYKWSEWTLFVMDKFPYRTADFIKSYSENQLMSKSWLVEHMKMQFINDNKDKEIWILGSWYGTLLVPLIRKEFVNSKIHLVDYDKDNLIVAKLIHGNIETHCLDVTFDLPEIETDIIINTSCEHMYPMKEIPMKGYCFYQSNNFREDAAHINCVDTKEEFAEQTGIENPTVLETQFHKYDEHHKRFMVHGKR